VNVDGDPSWGLLMLDLDEEAYSPVIQLGIGTHYVQVLLDKYGVGSGSVIIYIRGSLTSFGVLDVSPTWEVYTTGVNRTWTYMQVRLIGL